MSENTTRKDGPNETLSLHGQVDLMEQRSTRQPSAKPLLAYSSCRRTLVHHRGDDAHDTACGLPVDVGGISVTRSIPIVWNESPAMWLIGHHENIELNLTTSFHASVNCPDCVKALGLGIEHCDPAGLAAA